jgi:drug/metabolite transporter (DMT)-like permease
MNGLKILAIALIALGAIGLIYGQFSYTKETHKAEVGSLELAVKDKETVNIPQWAGVLAIAGGAVLLVVGSRRA